MGEGVVLTLWRGTKKGGRMTIGWKNKRDGKATREKEDTIKIRKG
jgi:hypothetical protein